MAKGKQVLRDLNTCNSGMHYATPTKQFSVHKPSGLYSTETKNVANHPGRCPNAKCTLRYPNIFLLSVNVRTLKNRRIVVSQARC